MSTTRAVHECLFCPQTFGSAAEKDDHTLEHFAQETCVECNQNLIRIGGNLYTIHNAVTCIKRELKPENPHTAFTTADEGYLLDGESNLESDTLQSICTEEIEIKVERGNLEDYHQFDCQPDSIEAQESDPHQLLVETSHENDNQDTVYAKPLAKRVDLLKHKRRNHDRTCKILKCEYCNQEVSSQSALDIHVVRCKRKLKSQEPHQPQQHFQMENDCSSMEEMNIKIEPEVIIESTGSIEHDEIDSLEDDMHVDTIQALETKPQSKKRNENSSRDNEFQCDVCSKIFKSKNSLRCHKKTHNPNYKRDCKICNKIFVSKQSLQRHNILKHRAPDTTFCKYCIKAFPTEEELLNHREDCTIEKNRKLKNRDCVCDVCGKKCSTSLYLQNHKVRMHSTLETIFCQICAKVFSTSDELLSHQSKCLPKHIQNLKKQRIRIKEKQLRVEMMECYLCKKVCKSKLSLKVHMRWNHLPRKRSNELPNEQKFMCTVCGQYLSTRYGLRRHMTMHTGERSYKCLHEGCEKSFRCSTSRTEHMRSHTGEKRYQCTIDGCDKRFGISLHLKQHKFKAHGIPFDSQLTCLICNKIYPANYLLKKHLETHKIQTLNE